MLIILKTHQVNMVTLSQRIKWLNVLCNFVCCSKYISCLRQVSSIPWCACFSKAPSGPHVLAFISFVCFSLQPQMSFLSSHLEKNSSEFGYQAVRQKWTRKIDDIAQKRRAVRFDWKQRRHVWHRLKLTKSANQRIMLMRWNAIMTCFFIPTS